LEELTERKAEEGEGKPYLLSPKPKIRYIEFHSSEATYREEV